jgi:hypothetical protein
MLQRKEGRKERGRRRWEVTGYTGIYQYSVMYEIK